MLNPSIRRLLGTFLLIVTVGAATVLAVRSNAAGIADSAASALVTGQHLSVPHG